MSFILVKTTKEESEMANKSPVPRTWKPTIAGILTIVGGAINVMLGIYTAFGEIWGTIGYKDIGAIYIVLGIIAVVGGIFALKRRVWGLALAGAICCLVSPPFVVGTLPGVLGQLPSVLGILSIVFVSIGKREFD